MRFLFALLLLLASSAMAQAPEVEGRYASIVVDADTLDILHARNADDLRYPASLTKVMTAVVVFDALRAGEVTLGTPMKVSERAAKTPPSRLGVKAGTTITVEDALHAILVKSANDVAVVIAEHLAGDVDTFAAHMSARAGSLGMSDTVFKTPNGLPDPEQVSSARDMAKLASFVLREYPEYYRFFGRKRWKWGKRVYKNTNGLLHSHADVDGFKTGFTDASGYNLMVSAERDGRRLIAVVLGGASGKSRNLHMSDLLDRSFEELGVRPVVRMVEAVPEDVPVVAALSLRRSDGSIGLVSASSRKVERVEQSWGVRLGAFRDAGGARSRLEAVFGLDPALGPGNAVLQPVPGGFEARFTGLSFDAATAICARLGELAGGCGLVATGSSSG